MTEELATLRLVYPKPGFMLTDALLEVTLDGALVRKGSFLEGFELSLNLPPGTHEVRTSLGVGPFARTKRYDVSLSPGVCTTATLLYSRFWGNFKSHLGLAQG